MAQDRSARGREQAEEVVEVAVGEVWVQVEAEADNARGQGPEVVVCVRIADKVHLIRREFPALK